VVTPVRPGAPRAPDPAAGGHGAVSKPQHRGPTPGHGMVDGYRPGPAGWSLAFDPEVAAQIGAYPGRPSGQELSDQEIGGSALADPPGVEPDAERQSHRGGVGVDPDFLEADVQARVRSARVVGEELEASVVAGSNHRFQDGGVEPALCDPGTFHGQPNQVQRLGGHTNGTPGPIVQFADLALRPEPAPSGLEVLDDLPGFLDE